MTRVSALTKIAIGPQGTQTHSTGVDTRGGGWKRVPMRKNHAETAYDRRMSSPVIPGTPAVVLLSGGLDSAVALAAMRRDGYACHALSFDYGQRHRHELA